MNMHQEPIALVIIVNLARPAAQFLRIWVYSMHVWKHGVGILI